MEHLTKRKLKDKLHSAKSTKKQKQFKKQPQKGTLNNNRTRINLKSPNNKYKKWNASMHKQITMLLQKYYLHFTQPNQTTQQTQIVKQTQLSQKQSRKVSKEPKRKLENSSKKATSMAKTAMQMHNIKKSHTLKCRRNRTKKQSKRKQTKMIQSTTRKPKSHNDTKHQPKTIITGKL